MNDRDTRDMIVRVLSEIKGLRSQVAELEPKAHAYDTIAIQTRLLDPARNLNRAYSEDIVYKLERELANLPETVSAAASGSAK